jgi:hypothetical protein
VVLKEVDVELVSIENTENTEVAHAAKFEPISKQNKRHEWKSVRVMETVLFPNILTDMRCHVNTIVNQENV